MLEDAATVGLAPAAVLDATTRELAAFARGRARAEIDHWRRALWAAWHTASYHRAKRLPDIARELKRVGAGPKRAATPERHLAQLEVLAAAFGAEPLKERPKLRRDL